MEQVYNKLVRDKIIDKIIASGEKPIYKTLSRKAYWDCLIEKDSEELAEVKAAETAEEILEELADKLEVLLAMGEIHGYTLEDIKTEADKKRVIRGSFSNRIYLEKVVD